MPIHAICEASKQPMGPPTKPLFTLLSPHMICVTSKKPFGNNERNQGANWDVLSRDSKPLKNYFLAGA
jgi:hypothetical protein